MEQDLNGFSISCHDDHLRDTTIESFSSLVRSLFCLLVVGSLLDQVKESNRHICIGEGESFFGHGVEVVCLKIEICGVLNRKKIDGWNGE